MQTINNIADFILAKPWLRHLAFWLGIIGIWTLFGEFVIGDFREPLLNKICYLPSQLLAFYGLAYYLLPELLFKKRYGLFALALLFWAYLTAALARFMKIYVYETVLYVDLPKDPVIDILSQAAPLLSQYMLWVWGMPTFALLVKLVRGHFLEKQALEAALKERTEAELRFLKAQIHPHFLFNTLNNLYTLTLRKSDEAGPTVGKLSEMMDYMFFECQASRVAIKKELTLLQNYIDLESLRYGDRLDLQFEHALDDVNTEIAPLLLLSIVENAFKHGASGDIGRPFIVINLHVQDAHLVFSVHNSKPATAQKDETQYKQGIGLKNTRRQLELIYPGSYQLDIEDQTTEYRVSLEIDLSHSGITKSMTYELA